MRTTVAVNDEVLAAAKRRARQRGLTLGQIIEAALQRDLASEERAGDRPSVPVFLGGTGPRPGIDLTSNRALSEALDDGVDLDARH